MRGHCTEDCAGLCGFSCGRPLASEARRPHRNHKCRVCHRTGPSPAEGQLPWRRPLSWDLPERWRRRGHRPVGWCTQPCQRGCGFACSQPIPFSLDYDHSQGAACHVCTSCRFQSSLPRGSEDEPIFVDSSSEERLTATSAVTHSISVLVHLVSIRAVNVGAGECDPTGQGYLPPAHFAVHMCAAKLPLLAGALGEWSVFWHAMGSGSFV